MYNYIIKLCSKKEEHDYANCNSCQKNTLIICFLINFAMFATEFVYGLIHQSASLLGDGAHNISDAFILGSSVFIISSTDRVKAKLALIKAIIMFLFGIIPLYQIYQNITTTFVPEHLPITLLGSFALVGNLVSTFLLLSYRKKDVNLKSAYICVRNDAIGNLLVITAGLAVMTTGSYLPDVIAGLIISLVIVWSSISIAKESLSILQKT
jgi:cation diffusion facilitator family transporter